MLPPWSAKPLIGMLHLRPLPGSPRYAGNLPDIRAALLHDAQALHAGGAHAFMLENFGDVPFYPGPVPAHVVAAVTALAADVRARFPDVPLGINVLRNDGRAALAVALAVNADFIRVNVLCGARVTDQGLVHGIAHDLLRDRAALHATRIQILADVDVKHSAPLAARPLADEVADTLHRGLADALIVSGAGTGRRTDPEHVRAVKRVAANTPVLVGSGVTPQNLPDYLPLCDGFIVGSALKPDNDPAQPMDPTRVAAFRAALDQQQNPPLP